MPFPIAATTAANTAGDGATRSRNAAPHRKNAAQRNRSDSPYQQRTTQNDNPTQVLIKQAVDYLIEQLNAGHSDMLAAYLRTMARFAVLQKILIDRLREIRFAQSSRATAANEKKSHDRNETDTSHGRSSE